MHQPSHPQPKPRLTSRKGFKFGCLPAIIIVWVLIVVSVITGGDDKKTGAASDAKASPTSSFSLSPKARASIRAAAGLPPSPGVTTREAYLADLDAIDPDIVHGKDDKAVSRGLSQCSSFKATKSRAKLIEYANFRFTSPNHPHGHGTAIAEKIVDVVHKHLCPDF